MAGWIPLWRDYLCYLAVRFVIAVIQVLPESKAVVLCRALAWLLAGPLPLRRSTLEENLARVFPTSGRQQRENLARAMWYHLMLMVCEIAWAPRRLHRCNWTDHVDFPNARDFLTRVLSRRACVLVTGHFGNFEMGGYITGLMGIDTLTIARRLDNRFLHDFVADFRGAKGQRLVDKEGCAPIVDRHLAEGGTLSILADQHAGPKGCWTDFLGHPASCHKALALFTLSGDAPMAVAYTIRENRPMQFSLGCAGVSDPRDGGRESAGVRQLTEWYNDRLAAAISLAPEQYWWVHRRWREKPARMPKSRAA
jgi:KDO2-lipid IV(A) lauroyltransferase